MKMLRRRHGISSQLSLPSVIAVFGLSWTLAANVSGETLFPWPGSNWQQTEPAQVGLDANLLQQARDYALSAGGSGMIVRNGKMALQWGDQDARYDIKSATKSIGATALGLAILDGKLALDDKAVTRRARG